MRSRTVLRWMGLAGALALMAMIPSVNATSPKRRVWTKPVLVSHEFAHRETSIAINPSERNPKQIFVCDPSGVPNTQHNQSFFHLSKDGGKTWKFIRVENDFGDTRNYFFEGGDCDVAMDSAGTLYTADTWLGSLSVGHSTDGGQNWQGTALAGTSPMVDRPWLVAGEEGTLYVTYQDVQCCTPSAIWFTKSTDYGQTFSPAVPVATFAGVPADPAEGPDGAYTWEGNFVVAGEGQDLYLVYTRRLGPAVTEQSGAETVHVAVSHDGGTTWTSEHVTSTDGPASYLYPSIAMDGGGGLHVVYSSAGAKDHPIWYSYSTDKAKTWTKPVPLLSGGSGYSPWVAAGSKAGEAAVAWYGSPDPEAASKEKAPWYFYTARVAHVNGGKLKISEAGTTTRRPIFTGAQTIPEFEMLRLDRAGNIHLGMSAFRTDPVTKQTNWAIYYQRQKRP
jgi:BNR repeat-like domain